MNPRNYMNSSRLRNSYRGPGSVTVLSNRFLISFNGANASVYSRPFIVRAGIYCLFCLFALISISGCGEDPQIKYDRLMKSAKDFSDHEKWEEARISLMSATELKPKDPKAYYELAEVLFHQQRFDRAVEFYKTTINYDPKHRDARVHLATLLLAGREFEQAEDQINKLLEINKEDIETLVLKANLEASSPRKNYDGAKKILLKVLEKDPNYSPAIAALGGVALSEGDLKTAEDYFTRALKIDQKDISLQMVMADLYARQGRLDDAQEIVESLIKDNPTNSGLRYGFGEFLLRRGLAEKATDQYEEILKSDPTKHEARDRLYDMYLVRKELDKAKALTAALVKAKPDDPGVNYFQGRDLELEGKPTEALGLYLKAISKMGNFAPPFRRAGLIEIQIGDERNGQAHLNQSITIDPADVGARLALARAALTNRNYAEATEHVNQILKRFPRQLGANVLRADIALLEGNLEQARRVYQYLIDTFPNNATGYFKLGLLEEKGKNDDQAIELYRKTLSFDTTVLLPAQRLAGLLVPKIGLESTIAEFQKDLEASKRAKPEYQLVIGSLLLTAGSDPYRFEKARKLLTDAVEGRPTLIGAYFALAAIDSAQGNIDSAVANYEKLIKQNPNHLPSYMLLALGQERQNKYQDAADTYRKLLTVAPRFAPAANNLAWLIADRLNGDLDEALKLAQVAKEGMPSEGSVADTLGWVNYKRGSKAVAESVLQEAVDLERKAGDGKKVNPEILFHLAQVQASLGEAEKAKATIAEAVAQAEGTPALQTQFKEFEKTIR